MISRNSIQHWPFFNIFASKLNHSGKLAWKILLKFYPALNVFLEQNLIFYQRICLYPADEFVRQNGFDYSMFCRAPFYPQLFFSQSFKKKFWRNIVLPRIASAFYFFPVLSYCDSISFKANCYSAGSTLASSCTSIAFSFLVTNETLNYLRGLVLYSCSQ